MCCSPRTSGPAQTELSLYCVFVDEGVQAVAFHAQRLELAGLEQAADGARAHGEQAPAEVWGVGARLAQRLARLGINSTLDLRRAPCAVRRREQFRSPRYTTRLDELPVAHC